MPWNSKYEQIVAGANKKYLDANNNFDLAEAQAKQDYGLDPGFNDPKSNPYSRAALLEQNYQNANRGTMNGAGLQLYSGSTSNALDSNRSAYDTNRNSLTKAYQEALGEISTGRTKAAEQKAEEEREAYWNRIGEAEDNELEPDLAPAQNDGGGGSGGARPPKRKAAPKKQQQQQQQSNRPQQTRRAVSNARKA